MIRLLLFFLLSVYFLQAQDRSRRDVRKEFLLCSNKVLTENLYSKIDLLGQLTPIELGYKGAAFASQARFSINPFTKFSFCKTGLTNISDAIKISPHDIELRYLRMLIETKIPNFLGMSENIIEDKMIIFSLLAKETDNELKLLTTDFLLKSGLCTDIEIKLLATI